MAEDPNPPWSVEFSDEFNEQANEIADRYGGMFSTIMAGAEYLLSTNPEARAEVPGTGLRWLVADILVPRCIIYFSLDHAARVVTVEGIRVSFQA